MEMSFKIWSKRGTQKNRNERNDVVGRFFRKAALVLILLSSIGALAGCSHVIAQTKSRD